MDLAAAWLGEVRAMVSGLRDAARVDDRLLPDHDALAERYINVLFTKLSRERHEFPSSVNAACAVSHAVLNVVLDPRIVSFNDVSGFMDALLRDRGVSAPGKQRLEKVARSMRTLACEGTHEPEERIVHGPGGTRRIEHCSRCMLVLARDPAGPAREGDESPVAASPGGATDGEVESFLLRVLAEGPGEIADAIADARRLHAAFKGPPSKTDESTVAALAAAFLGHVNLSDIARQFPTPRSTLSNRVIGIAKAVLGNPAIAKLGDIDFHAMRALARKQG